MKFQEFLFIFHASVRGRQRETERESNKESASEINNKSDRWAGSVGREGERQGRGDVGSPRHWTPLKSSQKMLGSAVVVVVVALLLLRRCCRKYAKLAPLSGAALPYSLPLSPLPLPLSFARSPCVVTWNVLLFVIIYLVCDRDGNR